MFFSSINLKIGLIIFQKENIYLMGLILNYLVKLTNLENIVKKTVSKLFIWVL